MLRAQEDNDILMKRLGTVADDADDDDEDGGGISLDQILSLKDRLDCSPPSSSQSFRAHQSAASAVPCPIGEPGLFVAPQLTDL